MSLYGAFDKTKHLSELAIPLPASGGHAAFTPAERVAAVLANLGMGPGAALPGAGITDGVGTLVGTSVQLVGGVYTTRILIDLTGLSSATSDLDIIGVGTGVAYLTQITEAVNGTIMGGFVTCLEAPLSLTDIDLYAAESALGAFEDGIAGLTGTETALVTSGGAWTAGEVLPLTGFPAADDYLYLVNGAADTADPFTAGRFLIELYGV